MSIVGVYHKNFHIPPHIPDAEMEKGASRFYQWHFDGALYDIAPPRVGCLLAVRTPKGPDCEVRWEDGTNTRMKIGPGSTACRILCIIRKLVQIMLTICKRLDWVKCACLSTRRSPSNRRAFLYSLRPQTLPLVLKSTFFAARPLDREREPRAVDGGDGLRRVQAKDLSYGVDESKNR
jgi:hypothetical protein